MQPIHRHFTTVTPFSKYLSMVLFVFFPVATFYLGMMYQKGITLQDPSFIPLTTRVEDREDLRQRCGTLSFENLKIKLDATTILNGPDWALDCRHIAWSLRDLQNAKSLTTGVYVYDEKTNQTTVVEAPQKAQEVITFERWKDANTLVFSRKVGDKTTFQNYSLLPQPTPIPTK